MTRARIRSRLIPGGDAAEDGVEVVTAQREQDGGGRGAQFGRVLLALSVRVNEVTDLR